MKVTLRVNLVNEIHEGDECDVVSAVAEIMNTEDNVQIISVEMTPKEQVTAFNFIVERV
jgi:glutamate formiminotransferase